MGGVPWAWHWYFGTSETSEIFCVFLSLVFVLTFVMFKKVKFQIGITRVPFGRTEVLVPPLEPQERDLAQGKGPRGP